MAKWDSVKDKLTLIEGWCRDGLTDIQIAHNLGITPPTLYAYKAAHIELKEAMAKGKEVIDIEVESALLKRALGYRYSEKVKELIKQPDGKYAFKVVREIEKEVVPDTTAQIFWLKNRKPKVWRDKQDVNIGGQEDNPLIVQGVDLSKLTFEQLKELSELEV